MKTVILCGGKGTRLNEETEFKPKPLINVGQYPILWHIMKIYSTHGHNEFILPLGYKGEMIKRFFMEHQWISKDFSFELKSNLIVPHKSMGVENWKIHFVDTGLESMTALRLLNVRHLLEDEEHFMLTYGDGVADININELIKFHKDKGKIATITGLSPHSRYGALDCEGHLVKSFREKPVLKDLINGGFMVFKKEIFNHIDGRNVMLVDEVLPKLAAIEELVVYTHRGFWHCMDTYRDYLDLNKLWKENPKWKVWVD